MAIQVAVDSFHVTIGGASVFVQKFDLYDSAGAVVTAAPTHFAALPTGTLTDHKHPQ